MAATKVLSVMGCLILSFAANVQAKLIVLSSIKPITLIAQEITGNTADIDTLLPATASPHDYPLKVSDYSRLQKANIILWVGPELESFLQKPINNLSRPQVITAYTLAGLNWPVVTHDSEEPHHHERDPHLWLDPRNAIIIARALTEQLMQIDSSNSALYKENLQVFSTKMSELDKKLLLELKPFSGLGFAVYHEGYEHFVSHYGLHQLDYVTFTPERRPGAKHLERLREVLAKEGNCLFLEPYYENQSVRDLAVELKLRIGILDALGSQVDKEDYSQFLQRMADAFAGCLDSKKH